jgi:hypothetical protein
MSIATRAAIAVTLWLQLAAQICLPAPESAGDNHEECPAFSPDPSKSGASPVERQPLGVASITGEPVRVWKDCLGNSIKGEFRGLHGATIFLVVEDEWATFPLAGFSHDDRHYVHSVLKEAGIENLFPGAAGLDNEVSAQRLTARQWRKQLDDWATAIHSRESQDHQTAVVAWYQLRAVRDPAALTELEKLIKRERNVTVQTACVEAIASLGGAEVTRLLVELAVADGSGAVRASAIWGLCDTEEVPTALAEHVRFVRSERFRDSALMSLQSSGLLRPLSPSETPNTELTTALIGSLTVKRSRYVPYYVWSGYDTGWTPAGDGRQRFYRHRGHGGFARIDTQAPCYIARLLLTEYTGEDFGYDKRAWLRWSDKE